MYMNLVEVFLLQLIFYMQQSGSSLEKGDQLPADLGPENHKLAEKIFEQELAQALNASKVRHVI